MSISPEWTRAVRDVNAYAEAHPDEIEHEAAAQGISTSAFLRAMTIARAGWLAAGSPPDIEKAVVVPDKLVNIVTVKGEPT